MTCITDTDFIPATERQLRLLTALARAGFVTKGVPAELVEIRVQNFVVEQAFQGRRVVSDAIARGQAKNLTPVWEPVETAKPCTCSGVRAAPSLDCPSHRPEVVQERLLPEAPANSNLDLSDLPEGRYAVPGGETRLKVQVDKPTNGKWAGYIFVRDAAEYGKGARYGIQRPDQPYHGEIREQLATICEDTAAATAAYGHLVGRCGVCGRKLEDESSVARGIGPVCAQKRGW